MLTTYNVIIPGGVSDLSPVSPFFSDCGFLSELVRGLFPTVMKGETLMCQICLSHYKECDGPYGPDALGASILDTPYGMSIMITTSSVLITIRKPRPRFSMWITTIQTPPTGTVPNLPGSGMPRQTRSFPFSGEHPIVRYYKVFDIGFKYYLLLDLIVSHSKNQT